MMISVEREAAGASPMPASAGIIGPPKASVNHDRGLQLTMSFVTLRRILRYILGAYGASNHSPLPIFLLAPRGRRRCRRRECGLFEQAKGRTGQRTSHQRDG